jgi:hypothetical protein
MTLLVRNVALLARNQKMYTVARAPLGTYLRQKREEAIAHAWTPVLEDKLYNLVLVLDRIGWQCVYIEVDLLKQRLLQWASRELLVAEPCGTALSTGVQLHWGLHNAPAIWRGFDAYLSNTGELKINSPQRAMEVAALSPTTGPVSGPA